MAFGDPWASAVPGGGGVRPGPHLTLQLTETSHAFAA